MSTEHSTGPWAVDEDGCVVAPFGKTAIAVAHVFKTPHGSKTAAANLRLIRAAPDLLEAASQALAHIEADEITHGRAYSAGEMLRAAIAKAVGPNTQVQP